MYYTDLHADGHKSGVNILQSLFGLQLPLTHKRYNKMRGTYFFKEIFARLLFIASVCVQHIYVYMYSCSIGLYNIY